METATPSATAVSPMPLDLSRIAQDLQIRKAQVEAVVQLLDEANTVPFITRYRKERTGGLNEDVIRRIQFRVGQLRHLGERKQTILKSIEAQGKLTDDLRAAVLAAESPKRLEDLYLPFKPKKRTLASDARDRGLEPLALAIWTRDPAVGNLAELLPGMVDAEKGLNTPDDVLQGVGHIIAELVAETADVRGVVRLVLWDTGRLTSAKSEALPEGKGLEYKDYFQFTEPVRHIPPHRVLAMNRGEKENALKVKLDFDADLVRRAAMDNLPLADHPHFDLLRQVVEDALTRLVLPSLEREVRRELTERAQDHAIVCFARNLRSLLLQPPLRGKRVLAIDPGFRTGCKVAVLDETGRLLEDGVIFPHAPQKRLSEARFKLEQLIRRHQTPVVAIGNGTACRETEELISGLIQEFDARRRGEVPPTLAPVESSPAAESPPAPESPPAAEVAPAPESTLAAESPPTPESPPAAEVAPPAIHAESSTTATEPPVSDTVPPEPSPDLPADAPILVPASDIPVPIGAPEPPPLLPGPHMPPAEPLPEPPEELAYVIVNEAGASDYSASPVAKEEFPSFDATLRGTISIGRRLQDPLSELVKIDPQHVGVGLYQHDVHPKFLKESLEGVIESCVNHVGVDLNTASVPLLRHVSGLNQLVARELVEFRQKNGPFRSRTQLRDVPGVGDVRFTQAAGFLKVLGGDEPLDGTWIHPESYEVARQIIGDVGGQATDLAAALADSALRDRVRGVSAAEVAHRLNVGEPTVRDILEALARPGRDPREDLPPPVFKKGVLKLEDLTAGMELKGTILNVVDFGAFVDVGLKDSGLVHISQMANRYIKSPHEVGAVGDVVTVWVLTVDSARRRVSLTMIPPGTERRQPERRPPAPRGEAPPRPPRPDQPRGEQPRRGPQPARGPRRPVPHHAGAPHIGRDQGPPQQQGPPPARRPLPERRPAKPKPLPTLTKAKREGKAFLTTLGELEAFFKSREEPAAPNQPTPPPAPEVPEAESPPPS